MSRCRPKFTRSLVPETCCRVECMRSKIFHLKTIQLKIKEYR
uniref:Uncharacterized protein n=1 Tax=Anguilla anguilla TaxID=7936 RepID=A0A0E9QRC8_ANGAN